MRLVFFGTPEWAVPALEALAGSPHEVRGVVTAPDAALGRSRRPVPPPVKRRALELGIGAVLQPETLRGPAARAAILGLEPDALAVVAYGRILPGRLLDAPRHGAINVHFSLLPRHRGAAPVQYTILCGDARGGVTTMKMARGLDTGPVLLQEEVAVGPGERAGELGRRLAAIGARLLLETLARVEQGADGVPQDEALATWAPPLRAEMGLVSWDWDAAGIWRRMRAFDPWPPVVCQGPRGTLRLLEGEPLGETAPGEVPGLVLRRAGDAVDVVCGGRELLRLRLVQPSGGRPMSGAAALAGRHLVLGERLTRCQKD
ncbi:MAG: methionyl-tRNA formyltransferase [Acidobacteria bacterium]|nr:methionyl-tRNA formyltransferase [Acidobacteriota bacterium]